MAESLVLRKIMLTCCRGAVRLFRNNCGALQDKNGTWVRYGVANPGGSDLIGWRSVTITPEMVGSSIAQFIAIECKDEKGRVRPEQVRFIAAVQAAGGIAGVARSPEQASVLLETLPARPVQSN